MKVVNSNDATHTITIIPRFDVSDDVDSNYIFQDNSDYLLQNEDSFILSVGTLNTFLYNEVTQEETLINTTTSYLNGKATIEFDYTFTESDKYQFKVTDSNNNVVYRGKIQATTQETQDYQVTKGHYTYGEQK